MLFFNTISQMSPHKEPLLNSPSSKHWSLMVLVAHVSVLSPPVGPWIFVLSLPLVSSRTTKPLWQLRSEALGDRIGHSYPCLPLARRAMTSTHTKHDPPDILFSLQTPLETNKDDPGEVMQL